jgi:hypothetical protein
MSRPADSTIRYQSPVWLEAQSARTAQAPSASRRVNFNQIVEPVTVNLRS